MRTLMRACLVILVSALALPAIAQSPNTATLVVVVVDQTGAVVNDAKVSVVNSATGATREAVSGADGSASIAALSLTGTYTISVAKPGFTADDVRSLTLRAGETATVNLKLVASGGQTEVTVYGTTQGVRADAQLGRRLDDSTIDETPILGRKVTTLPLLNASFRQAKGTGDLFVNATYFVTGAGGRRQTTVTLDGANNDEGWGRQTMLATVPIGAIQEMSVLSNAFSAEFGWTAGPALNIVTKSGTNALHGEVLAMGRPGDAQAKTFSTKGFCAPSVASCTTPSTLAAINPADVPDALAQFSGSAGAPLVKDKTFFFATADYTMQDRTTFLSPTLPSFVLPADGNLAYEGNYRQALFNGRLDHQHLAEPGVDVPRQRRSLLRHQPERRGRRHERAERRPQVLAPLGDRPGQPHLGRQLEHRQRGAVRVSRWRPGHAVGSADAVDHLHARRLGAVHDRPVAPLGLVRPAGAALRHALVGARPPQRPRGRQPGAPQLRRHRQRARVRRARHVHLPGGDNGAARSADAGPGAAVHGAGELRRHQLRAEPVARRGVRAGQHPRRQRPHASMPASATTARR